MTYQFQMFSYDFYFCDIKKKPYVSQLLSPLPNQSNSPQRHQSTFFWYIFLQKSLFHNNDMLCGFFCDQFLSPFHNYLEYSFIPSYEYIINDFYCMLQKQCVQIVSISYLAQIILLSEQYTIFVCVRLCAKLFNLALIPILSIFYGETRDSPFPY